MRHRFGALPVRTSALVAVCLLALVLAGRLISGPSSTLASRPSPPTITAAPVTPAFAGEPRVLVPPTRIEGRRAVLPLRFPDRGHRRADLPA